MTIPRWVPGSTAPSVVGIVPRVGGSGGVGCRRGGTRGACVMTGKHRAHKGDVGQRRVDDLVRLYERLPAWSPEVARAREAFKRVQPPLVRGSLAGLAAVAVGGLAFASLVVEPIALPGSVDAWFAPVPQPQRQSPPRGGPGLGAVLTPMPLSPVRGRVTVEPAAVVTPMPEVVEPPRRERAREVQPVREEPHHVEHSRPVERHDERPRGDQPREGRRHGEDHREGGWHREGGQRDERGGDRDGGHGQGSGREVGDHGRGGDGDRGWGGDSGRGGDSGGHGGDGGGRDGDGGREGHGGGRGD